MVEFEYGSTSAYEMAEVRDDHPCTLYSTPLS